MTELNDPFARHLGYLLRRASAVMMADLGTALIPLGLRPVEATILSLIAANQGCTQSDIGRMLGIKRANMVPLMASLSAKGLIEKSRVDGRSQALGLTDQGALKQRDAIKAIDVHEAKFGAALSKVDIITLQKALIDIAGAQTPTV